MSRKALVIEDNDNNMELITFILESSGYKALRAYSGEQGFAMAITDQPDFIILDIQLPDIEGTEVLQSIRRKTETALIPVIAMTSYAMSGDREKLLAYGCNGYIEKPIDPDRVIEQIKKVLMDVTK